MKLLLLLMFQAPARRQADLRRWPENPACGACTVNRSV